MIIENLLTLKIHQLSKEQYERELAAGNIDASALYLTPDNSAEAEHKHDASDIKGTISLDNLPILSIEKGGTNASTTAGARSNLELNCKIYTAMSQINLSGAMTTTDVIAAMPNNSVMLLSNNTDTGTNYLSDVPAAYSIVELRRDISFGSAKAVKLSTTDPEFYEANWHSTNGFSGWQKKVAYSNDTLNSVLSELGALNLNNVATDFAIASGDDLDNYTTPGVYVSSNNTITSSLSNAPGIAAGFRMIVSTGSASATAMQIAIGNDTKGTILFRNKKTNGSWQAWEKILRNVLTSSEYGSTLPSTGTTGQVFFLKG